MSYTSQDFEKDLQERQMYEEKLKIDSDEKMEALQSAVTLVASVGILAPHLNEDAKRVFDYINKQ